MNSQSINKGNGILEIEEASERVDQRVILEKKVKLRVEI